MKRYSSQDPRVGDLVMRFRDIDLLTQNQLELSLSDQPKHQRIFGIVLKLSTCGLGETMSLVYWNSCEAALSRGLGSRREIWEHTEDLAVVSDNVDILKRTLDFF